MDDQLLLYLYHRLFDPDKFQSSYDCVYSDALIVLIHFLAVIRDRSMRWAHSKRNWPLWMRRLESPSYSQLMRRLKTQAVKRLIAELNLEFRNTLPDSQEKFCDGLLQRRGRRRMAGLQSRGPVLPRPGCRVESRPCKS